MDFMCKMYFFCADEEEKKKKNIKTSSNRIRTLKVLQFLYYLCMLCLLPYNLGNFIYPLSQDEMQKKSVAFYSRALVGVYRKKVVATEKFI